MQRGGKNNSSEFIYMTMNDTEYIDIYKYKDAASDVFFMQ